jgi:hypothetical protein
MPSRGLDPDSAPREAFVLEGRYDATKGAWHQHRRAQLVHAAEGVLVISTEEGKWVAPPARARACGTRSPHAGRFAC